MISLQGVHFFSSELNRTGKRLIFVVPTVNTNDIAVQYNDSTEMLGLRLKVAK